MKSLWKREYTPDEINRVAAKTIHTPLGIRITGVAPDHLVGTMPVDERTHQPAGLLHGGASGVLVESLGSIASSLVVGMEFGSTAAPQPRVLGLEMSVSHVKAVRSGTVTGTARPVSLKRSVHLWEVRITDEAGELVCQGRITVLVKDPKA